MMADIKSYQIRKATTADVEKVTQMMQRSFYRDEPLNVAVGLMKDTETCPELENFFLEKLSDGLSLIAVGPNGDVVGACINGCHEPGDVQQMEVDADVCPNPKFRKILKFLAFVDRRADVFGKFPEISKLLEITMVAVDDNWRGKGIATALLDRTRQIAPELGFTLIKADCTSYFSALAMRKLGAQCVFSMKYADYCAPDSDQPVFQPEYPHTAVQTFVQTLPRAPNAVRSNGIPKTARLDQLDR
jgi:GNAT superfamily N-acetyltransferase